MRFATLDGFPRLHHIYLHTQEAGRAEFNVATSTLEQALHPARYIQPAKRILNYVAPRLVQR